MTAPRSVLVLNAGSSSLKYALYNVGKSFALAMSGLVEQIGTPHGSFTHKSLLSGEKISQDALFKDHKEAMTHTLQLLGVEENPSVIYAVGHRVVHGGENISEPCIIDEHVKGEIERNISLAPLHNPPNLMGIVVAQELLKCPQVAVFDTAFHATMPPKSYMYAIPYALYDELKIRRYGMHGTSYKFLLQEAARFLNKPQDKVNMIACHLGAGASMAAIKEGKCIDTTMGVTPLEGLVMATRSGDIDPAIMKILSDLKGLTPGQLDGLLNKQSGLFGICGEKDMKTIVEKAAEGDELHTLALEVFVHRVRKYLGAYLVHLGGQVDAIVFSAGIGERSAPVRQLVCQGLEPLGIILDDVRNEAASKESREISAEGSKYKVLVLPTDEELSIAQQTVEVVEGAKLLEV